MTPSIILLSTIVFLPAVGALVLAFFPKGKDESMKLFALATAAVVFMITAWMACGGQSDGSTEATSGQFQQGVAEMQNVFHVSWIPAFNIHYFMGIDGISFPLLVLTSFLSLMALGASWSIKKHVKGYLILFLLLETGMLGVFMSLDFFLFYIFWEVMLLPMYFLIGIWGGPRREYAAIKFFLYTLLGSVCMLVAILMLYFNSDVRELAKNLSREEMLQTHLVGHDLDDVELVGEDAAMTVGSIVMRDGQEVFVLFRDKYEVIAANAPLSNEQLDFFNDEQRREMAIDHQIAELGNAEEPIHTFNLLALQKMGQKTDLFNDSIFVGKSIQWWAFILLFIGFIIKVPCFPFHTWLPDAHVEAPTPISMILAGVLLKMGGYGIIRICYPICPEAAHDLAWFVCTIGAVSMVFGAFAALAQKDFKRLVAYSSVSHMGYVVLGLGIWSATGGNNFDADYYKMGMNGAMFQMIAHGISSAGMFFIVGVIYERVHHRDVDQFGGLFPKMPVYCALAWVLFLAGVGLPGLCGFIGEAFVVLSIWSFSKILGIIAAFTVILTAGYILWTFQRVFLGAEYNGPHEEALVPSTLRENIIASSLVIVAILFGVAPKAAVFDYMSPSVNKTVDDLVDWQKRKAAEDSEQADSEQAAIPDPEAVAQRPD